MTAICISAVGLYQRFLSPQLGDRCRYEPTCSRYAVLSLAKYGSMRGLYRAAARLLSCGPWSKRPYVDYP